MNDWENETFAEVFPDDVVRVVDYASDDQYEGQGAAIGKNAQGYWWAEYSHCSCYSTLESMSSGGPEPTYELALRYISEYNRDALPAVEP